MGQAPNPTVPPAVKAFPAWQEHQFLPWTRDEVSPFVFKGKKYLLENVLYHYYDGHCHPELFHEDHFRIRDAESGRVISRPLLNHYFAQIMVKDGRVHVFTADYGEASTWQCRQIVAITSEDLISWTAPIPVIRAENENLFNNSVTEKDGRYYMVYESDDCRYPKFTAKFAKSDDLIHWEKIPGAVYGRQKYVGGPAMEYMDGFYYVTYVNCFINPETGERNYDTRIARSKDLIDWEDSSQSVLMPLYDYPDPERPELQQTNASDAEFLERDGKVICYWNGGNQVNLGGSYVSEYSGTLKQLFESFF